MSDTRSTTAPPDLEDVRQHKVMFDNTWTLATVLATALAVLCWYFRLAQVNIGPIICALAGLAVAQLGINSLTVRVSSKTHLQLLALSSQLTGMGLLGLAWHLFGGLQQPLFPLFALLPLVPAALVLSFWQEQVAVLGLLGLLISGVALSPDTNSFIEERYGISIIAHQALPGWIPKSHVAFSDVSTSPAYDLMLIITVGVVSIAVSTTARALVSLCRRATGRVSVLERDLARLLQQNAQLVTRAPAAEVLVSSATGSIVAASDRFARAFDVTDASGRFLLDTIAFAYPAVIRRLVATGGEEIQGATLRGRDVVLRVRAEVMGSGASQVTALTIEPCDEICWRGAVDALDEAVFAVNSRGVVVFLNRTALQNLGASAVGIAAADLFDAGGAWWDIAPLESARRILERGGHRYLASVRRERVAESIGELSIVHLRESQSVTPSA
jgi:PAS domain-containing protein